MFFTEGIGFGGEEDEVAAGQGFGVHCGIAVGSGQEVVETAAPKHVMDKGVAAGGHIGVAPDKVGGGERDGQGAKGIETLLYPVREGPGLRVAVGEAADGADHVERVGERFDVADPYGIAAGEVFDLLFVVLFLIGDDQVGFERVDYIGMDVLSAANAGLPSEPGSGMDTKFGNANDLVFEAKCVE